MGQKNSDFFHGMQYHIFYSLSFWSIRGGYGNFHYKDSSLQTPCNVEISALSRFTPPCPITPHVPHYPTPPYKSAIVEKESNGVEESIYLSLP